MDAASKEPKPWSLRTWLRGIFKRHSDKTAPAICDDPPSPRSNLTKAEKRMIMKAMPGYWYVCRHNHPYLVGNCGVPLELAFCPTCGDRIGGSGYTAGNKTGTTRGTTRIHGLI